MKRYRRAQLFLIEIIVALSVLFVLVTTLFATQTVTSPPEGNGLGGIGQDIMSIITENGQLYEYLDAANYSYYSLDFDIFDESNSSKLEIMNSIDASIPLIANYKAFTYRNNTETSEWELIDIMNYEAYTPSGSEISIVEHYIPGFNGVFDEFRFQLYIWYEVQS